MFVQGGDFTEDIDRRGDKGVVRIKISSGRVFAAAVRSACKKCVCIIKYLCANRSQSSSTSCANIGMQGGKIGGRRTRGPTTARSSFFVEWRSSVIA